MLWNKNYYATTVIIPHTAGTDAAMNLVIIAPNVLVIVAKTKKNRTAYESK